MNTLMKRNQVNGNQPTTSFSGMVDKIFQDNLNRFFDDDFWGFRKLNQSVGVPVNVKETDKDYQLELIAPGLKKEDLKVNISNNMLTVSMEHREENNQDSKDAGWLRREYQKSSFTRSFTLDDSIDTEKITAAYNDGILHLSIPKKEGAQNLSRTIQVE